MDESLVDVWLTLMKNAKMDTIEEVAKIDFQGQPELFEAMCIRFKEIVDDKNGSGPSNVDGVNQHGGAVDQDSDQEISYDNFIEIGPTQREKYEKFESEVVTFPVQFRNLDLVDDISELTKHGLQKGLDHAYGDTQTTGERVAVEIHHPLLEYPIEIPLSRREHVTGEAILNEIEKVAQSRKGFSVDEKFVMKIVRVAAPSGSGKRRFEGNFEAWSDQSGHGSSLIKIRNNDQLCLARAVVTAKAWAERKESKEKERLYKTVREGDGARCTAQKRLATQLMQDAGLAGHQGPCGIPELKKIQDVLPDIQIKVHQKEKFFAIIFKGEVNKPKVLHLILANNHYDVYTSMPILFGKAYYCETCDRGFDEKKDHLKECGFQCSCCLSRPPCKVERSIFCNDCRRWFYGPRCFANHKADIKDNLPRGPKTRKIQTVCEQLRLCGNCKQQLDKNHVCNSRYCNSCKKNVLKGNHMCFMQPTSSPKKPRKPYFLFFDLECVQSKKISDVKNLHEPNCAISWRVCAECWTDPGKPCEICGPEKVRTFMGRSSRDDFAKYLFSEENKGVTAVAHNMTNYDGQFLIDYIEKQGKKPKIIPKGLGVLQILFEDVRVIDSYKFLPYPLAALPKIFGFQESKGFFTHYFNTFENMDYEGDLPPKESYDPGNMKNRKPFDEWYDKEDADMKRTGRKYVQRIELPKYCKMDVHVLLLACMNFRKMWMEMFDGLDPLIECITMPSACSAVFRRLFLKPETIALVPPGGYRREFKQSVQAIKYLKFYAEENDLASKNQFIQHAKNGGEVTIGPYRVDGLLRRLDGTDLKKVFESNGCYYHGCTSCYDKDKVLHDRFKAHELRQRTMEKRKFLEDQGYEVVEVWGCEIARMLKSNPKMKEFFEKCEIQEPLNARDAFFGGRTNACKLYHKCSCGEKGKYCDVCSLYPWVCKYGEFPVGHPVILTENFKRMTADEKPYRGLAKVRILPPRGLFHPVLPYRSLGKLTFPLCGLCADQRKNEECRHTDDERSFWGTCPTLELYKALELGYEILDVVEVWHWEEWAVFDGSDPETGFFTKYVNANLKVKQENSGWPKWIKTDEDREKYLREYEEKEGIKLDPDQIQKNPGKRALAKLALNSFWGKFGQCENMSTTEYVDDLEGFYRITNDETLVIKALRFVGTDLVCLKYQNSEESIEGLLNTNVVIAALVTCQARLKLFSYLEKLGDRVLYFDTNSIVFISRPGEYEPEAGDFLGDMTDELEEYGPGAYIKEFVSGGPKQYGYGVAMPDGSEKCEIKLRGVTRTENTKNILGYETLRKMVKERIDTGAVPEIEYVAKQIRKTKDRNLLTVQQKKTYRPVYDKRRLLSDGNTLPFGY